MHQEQRTRPTTPEDLHRLADLAHARGLRVFEIGSHRWFCTSHSNPFALHAVTAFSCDCRGFMHNQRCSHHALLLAHLGWLPEVEPDLPYVEAPPTDCVECCGCGLQDFGRYSLPCETCGGSGLKVDRR